jgi:hypothetical protein
MIPVKGADQSVTDPPREIRGVIVAPQRVNV